MEQCGHEKTLYSSSHEKFTSHNSISSFLKSDNSHALAKSSVILLMVRVDIWMHFDSTLNNSKETLPLENICFVLVR